MTEPRYYTLDEFALMFETHPDDKFRQMWEDAALYDIRYAQSLYDPNQGKFVPQYTQPWGKDGIEHMSNPTNRAGYIVEHVAKELQKVSVLHAPPSFSEKYKYLVSDVFDESQDVGLKSMTASATRLWVEDEKKWADVDRGITGMFKRMAEYIEGSESDEDKNAVERLFEYLHEEYRVSFSPEGVARQLAGAIEEKIYGEGGSERRLESLQKINEAAEEASIKEIKKWQERKEKDPRWYAFQHYMENKPVGWGTTFDIEDSGGEYFVDTMLGLVPSIAIGAVSTVGALGVGAVATRLGQPQLAGKLASIVAGGISVGGFMPLEATSSYPEAYLWTMEKYGDEELARNNAAVATAQNLLIVGVTEGWGGGKLAKIFMPGEWYKAGKAGLTAKLFKRNVADEARRKNIKNLSALAQGGTAAEYVRFKQLLKSPFREAAQEYIQLMGDYGTQMGYKDETFDEIYNPAEVHESVVGGGLMGFLFGAGSMFQGRSKKFKEQSVKDLKDLYGIDLGDDFDSDDLGGPPPPPGSAPEVLRTEASSETYMAELLNSKRDVSIVVDRDDPNTPPKLRALINKHEGYSGGRVIEKVADLIRMGGDDFVSTLPPAIMQPLNEFLKGSIQNINPKVLEIVTDPENLVKDFVDRKINVASRKKGGKFVEGRGKRKVQILDEGYIDSIVGMYSDDIAEKLGEDATSNKVINMLARDYDIQISKTLKENVQSSMSTHIEESIKEEASSQAAADVEKSLTDEALSALGDMPGFVNAAKSEGKDPEIIGKKAAILAEKGKASKFKNQVGKIVAWDKKNNKVKMEDSEGKPYPILFKPEELGIMDEELGAGEKVKGEVKEVKDKVKPPMEDFQERITKGIAEAQKGKPAEKWAAKEQVKSRIATQFIGQGKKGSSTDVYRDLYAKEGLANTGQYTKEDIVFVASNGKRAGGVQPVNKEGELQGVYKEMLTKAMDAGASIIMDTSAHLKATGGYNTGEVALSEYMKKHGYAREGGTGLWRPVDQKMSDILKPIVKGLIDDDERAVVTPKKRRPLPLGKKIDKIIGWKDELKNLMKAASLQQKMGQLPNQENMARAKSLQDALSEVMKDGKVVDALRKRGLLDEFKGFQKKERKLHKPVADDTPYWDDTPVADKQFILDAVKDVMGRHTPEQTKMFVDEIEGEPDAAGEYVEGMVKFVQGKATEHTAYHEPVHWFMHRVLNDSDYDFLHGHFGDDESMTIAAAEYRRNQLTETLPEKVKRILKKFWRKIKELFETPLTDDQRITDIFDRIGADRKIRNWEDRHAEVGLDPELPQHIEKFDGKQRFKIDLEYSTGLPVDEILDKEDPTVFDFIDKFYKYPQIPYIAKQGTLDALPELAHPVLAEANISNIAATEAPISAMFKEPAITYGFSKIIEKFSGGWAQLNLNPDQISKGKKHPWSDKGLTKYEKVVLRHFYEYLQNKTNNIDDDVWYNKRRIEKDIFQQEYENFIQTYFPLNVFAMRHQSSHVNEEGNIMPHLFSNILSSGSGVSHKVLSARIHITNDKLYKVGRHSMSFDPQSVGALEGVEGDDLAKMKWMVQNQDKVRTDINSFQGMGWFNYVEMENLLPGVAITMEFQRDIDKAINLTNEESSINYGALFYGQEIEASDIETATRYAERYLNNQINEMAMKRYKGVSQKRAGDELIFSYFVRWGYEDRGGVNNFKVIMPFHEVNSLNMDFLRTKRDKKIKEMDITEKVYRRHSIMRRIQAKIADGIDRAFKDNFYFLAEELVPEGYKGSKKKSTHKFSGAHLDIITENIPVPRVVGTFDFGESSDIEITKEFKRRPGVPENRKDYNDFLKARNKLLGFYKNIIKLTKSLQEWDRFYIKQGKTKHGTFKTASEIDGKSVYEIGLNNKYWDDITEKSKKHLFKMLDAIGLDESYISDVKYLLDKWGDYGRKEINEYINSDDIKGNVPPDWESYVDLIYETRLEQGEEGQELNLIGGRLNSLEYDLHRDLVYKIKEWITQTMTIQPIGRGSRTNKPYKDNEGNVESGPWAMMVQKFTKKDEAEISLDTSTKSHQYGSLVGEVFPRIRIKSIDVSQHSIESAKSEAERLRARAVMGNEYAYLSYEAEKKYIFSRIKVLQKLFEDGQYLSGNKAKKESLKKGRYIWGARKYNSQEAVQTIVDWYIFMGKRMQDGLMDTYGDFIQQWGMKLEDIRASQAGKNQKFEEMDMKENLSLELNNFRKRQIYKAIQMASSRGKEWVYFPTGEANTIWEGGSTSSRQYVSEFEVKDSRRATSFEDWHSKKKNHNLPWVDKEFGNGTGNHIMSEPMLIQQFDAWLNTSSGEMNHGAYGNKVRIHRIDKKEMEARIEEFKKIFQAFEGQEGLSPLDPKKGVDDKNKTYNGKSLEYWKKMYDTLLQDYNENYGDDWNSNRYEITQGGYDQTWVTANPKTHEQINDRGRVTKDVAMKVYKDAPREGVFSLALKQVVKDLGLELEPKIHAETRAMFSAARLEPGLEVKIPRFLHKPVRRPRENKIVKKYQPDGDNVIEIASKTTAKSKYAPIRDAISQAVASVVGDPTKYEAIGAILTSTFKHLNSKYNIPLEDFSSYMYRAFGKLSTPEQRMLTSMFGRGRADGPSKNAYKNIVVKWAREQDPNVNVKKRRFNKAISIVEAMGKGGKLQSSIHKTVVGGRVMEAIQSELDGKDEVFSHDTTREGLENLDSSDVEEIASDLTFESYDFRGDRFFKFLEGTMSTGWLDPAQTRDLMENAKFKDFDTFVKDYLFDVYDFKIQTVEDYNMVRSFWVRNQHINRQSAVDKPSWWYANLTEDGKRIKNTDDKRLIPKIGGHPKYGKDIRSNKDLPTSLPVSFLDWDAKSYEYETGDIKVTRIYLNDIVDVWKGDRNDKGETQYYSKGSFLELGEKDIAGWDMKLSKMADDEELGRGVVRTIWGIKSGGNKPSFLVARASKEIMDLAEDTDAIFDYFDVEVERGRMTESQKTEILNDIVGGYSTNNKHPAAQKILEHEMRKRARGADYLMRTPDMTHHFRRLAIDDGEGAVAIGVGDRTIKIVDHSKTFVSKGEPGTAGASKAIPMKDYIAGLDDVYNSDGALWTDSEMLDDTGEMLGRVPLQKGVPIREIKSRIRFVSKNDSFSKDNYEPKLFRNEDDWEGIHYFASKHNEFVPEENIYITDGDGNVIIYTTKDDSGNIRIFDGDHNRVNQFATLDEAKEPDGGSGAFKLNGRVSTDILTLPEESRRIVKVPKQRAHNSSAFPWPWMSHLFHSDFDALRDAILVKMLNVARGNIRAMFTSRKNPEVLAALMGQMKSDGLSIVNEVDRLIEPDKGNMLKDGYNIPHIIGGLIEPIKSRMLKENSYRSRRRGLGNFPVIKPDLTRTIVKNEDGVVVSGDDTTTVNFLKKRLNVTGSGDELLNNINESLRTNKQYLLVGRQPVYTPAGLFLATVEKVMPRGHGNVTWLHPDTVKGRLQADHDGDNSFFLMMYFGENYTDASIVNLMKSPEVKGALDGRADFARLEYFKNDETEYKMTSKKDMYKVGGKIGAGLYSQGVMTNAIQFFEDMYFKGFKATIGGQEIVARDPENNNRVIDYAPLKDNVTDEMLKESGMGWLVDKDGNEWEGGERYLMTNPLMEMKILFQAAVDNAKEYLLSHWQYEGYKFLMKKMFIQSNGSQIGNAQARTISQILRKLLSHGYERRGRDQSTLKSKSMPDMFEASKNIYELNQLSNVERGEEIKERANKMRLRFGDSSRLVRGTKEVDKLSFNNKLTSLEQLLAIPHEQWVEYENDNPDDKVYQHPWGYSPNRMINAIVQTQKDLYSMQKQEDSGIGGKWYPNALWEKDKKLARRWINNAGGEFYKVAMRAKAYDDANKSRLTASGYPYSEEMTRFIKKWLTEGDKKLKLPPWGDLTKEQQAYATLRFLRGIIKKEQGAAILTKRSKDIVKSITSLREKLINEPDIKESRREMIEDQIEKKTRELDKVVSPKSLLYQSRVRDIEKYMPMQLMDKRVWREFAERLGANIRAAGEESPGRLKLGTRYEDKHDKQVNEILKGCKK